MSHSSGTPLESSQPTCSLDQAGCLLARPARFFLRPSLPKAHCIPSNQKACIRLEDNDNSKKEQTLMNTRQCFQSSILTHWSSKNPKVGAIITTHFTDERAAQEA